MSSTTSTRTVRTAAGLLAAGLALTACSFGSGNVSCTPTSCTATLSGDGAKAEILGTTLEFGGVQDGRATLGVGGASVSCAEGEKVSAGPLSVTCTSVTDDAVELTASLG
ncbi:MAG: uncharacterized protein JWR45_3035 [Blastococcus sp.]|jgi:hypothetical protein|nr:uncharacterized protein [Blastococcus sp.]